MKMKMKTRVALTALLMTSNAWALPTIYPTEAMVQNGVKILNPTDSNVIADTVDPNKFYVMPPRNAHAKISKKLYLQTSNLGFCAEMGDLQQYSRSVGERIDGLKDKQQANYNLNNAKREEILALRTEMANYVATNDLTEIQNIDLQIIEIDIKLKDIYAQISTCRQACNILYDDRNQLLLEKKNLGISKARLARENSERVKAYESYKMKIAAFEADVEYRQKDLDRLDSALKDLKNSHIETYYLLGAMEGGRTDFEFSSNWTSNIDQLKSTNPSFNFEEIPTSNTLITTDIPDLLYTPTSKAILGYRVSGCINDPSSGACKAPSYPSRMSGTVVLSTIGACPIVHPEYFDIDPQYSYADHMTMGITASFEYPSASIVEASATYNMKKMYEYLKTSWSKGGFFKNKKGTTTHEQSSYHDSFIVKWIDPNSLISLEKKEEMADQFSQDIYKRMAAMAMPLIPNPQELLVEPLDKNTGAFVLSESMQNHPACQLNKYCGIASIGINVLNSIFGSLTNSTEVNIYQDANLETKWSSTTLINHPYITTYVRKK